MRGAISLAIALTLPRDAGGKPFAARSTLIFLAAVVVVATLVGEGLTLGPLLSALGLAEGDEQRRREAKARARVTEAGLARLDQLAGADEVDEDTANVYRQLFELRLERVRAILDSDDNDGEGATGDVTDDTHPHIRHLRTELVHAQRDKLDDLYRRGKISDEIRRSIAGTLDQQERGRL
jgi:CPA1 family monovalent cation:H+ antiporter